MISRRSFLVASIATACGDPHQPMLSNGLTIWHGVIDGGGAAPPEPDLTAIEGQEILLTATAGDITINGEAAGTYSAPFLWTPDSPGLHTVQIGADSLLVSVEARLPRLIEPPPGRIVIGDDVTFTAEAFDDAATDEVLFSRDDEQVANDAGSAPWSATYAEAGGAVDTFAFASRITGGAPVDSPDVAYRVIADPGTPPALPSNDFAFYAHSGVSLVEVSRDERRVQAITPTAGNDIVAPSEAARPWIVYDALSGQPAIHFRGAHELGRAAGGVNLGDGGCFAIAYRMLKGNGGLQTLIRSASAARQMFGTTGSGLSNGLGGIWEYGSFRITDVSNEVGGTPDGEARIAIVKFYSDTTPDTLQVDGPTIISSNETTGAGTGIQLGDDSTGVIGQHFLVYGGIVYSGTPWDSAGDAAAAAHLRHAANFPGLPAWVP